MALVDTYLRNAQRKKADVMKLTAEKAKEQLKSSDLSKKLRELEKHLALLNPLLPQEANNPRFYGMKNPKLQL